MNNRSNLHKFLTHLRNGGIFYALWRGIKFLIFLIRLGLTKRFKNDTKEVQYISNGNLKIVPSGCGVNILWNDQEVTRGAGLNLAINTLGLWTDSAKSDWTILQKTQASFKFKVVFKELPLLQIWTLTIEDEETINWQIDMELSEWLNIDEFRLVSFVNQNYKSWIVNYRQEDFPMASDRWCDLCVSDENVHLVGARFPIGEVHIPSFAIETIGDGFFPLIQNPPLSNACHIVGFRHINLPPKNDYPQGYHHFLSARIKLFNDNHSLDNKIESMRLNLLEAVIGDRAKNTKTKRSLKLVLANMPWQKDGKWGVRAGSRWPHIKDCSEGNYLPFPFFLAYATSLLKKYDFDATLIDAIASELPEDSFIEKIISMDCDYLIVETSIPSYSYDLELLRKIAQRGIGIILCGANSEIYEREFLKKHTFVDFVLYGEYEFTLLELIRNLGEGKDLFNVRGLIYRSQGEIRKNLARPPFDINLLPWPHREGLPIYKYLDAPGEMLTPSVQMMASRGCPFKCLFCLWPQVIYQGHHYRSRTSKDIVDEMEHLVVKKGFKSVYFDDDTFNIGKKRMLGICREIIQRGLQETQWAIMARPDLMDEEILDNMKMAGLWAVKYGVESADQGLIDNIKKGMDLKTADKMINYTQRLGIKTHLTFTFGLPGETKQTIEKTIKYAEKANPFSAQFSITTPFPGTQYFKDLEMNGLIVSKDFSSYDGHYKSVIRLKNLSPADLESAKERACRVWADHMLYRRGFIGNIRRFYCYVNDRGLILAISKVFSYFKYLLFKKRIYLSSTFESSMDNRISKKSKKSSTKPVPVDILLIQSPPWDIEMPPLSIAYLGEFLKKHGYKENILDLNIALYNLARASDKYLWDQKSYDLWVQKDLFIKTWDRLKHISSSIIKEKLNSVQTEYIGLSVNFASIHFANEVMAIIKNIRPETKIILGGWGCVNGHMRGLFKGDLVDAFVIGEGEETLLDTINFFKKGKADKGVRGVVFNKKYNCEYTPRPPIMNLDSIPWPTFKGFDLGQYKNQVLPLFASRGCIGNCSFCNDWPTSKPYRFRSAKNTFSEISYHVEYNRRNNFSFKDLLCNGNIKELNLLCDLIIGSRLKVRWDSQAIPRKEMTYELLTKLKDSGCSTLIYGIESFSDNVLLKMKKLFTKEIAERVLRDTHKAGINTIFNIIVGFPGETEEDFRETLEVIRANRDYIGQIGAVSVCLANGFSDLQVNPGAFGIVIPEDPAISAKQWHSNDGINTYALRCERAERILNLINELDFEYATKTV